MECPEDADSTPPRDRCGAAKLHGGQIFVCTRERGHEDDHHCHDMMKKCRLVWNVQEDSYYFAKGDVVDTAFVQRLFAGLSGHFEYSGEAEDGKVPAKVRCVKGLELRVRG